ncbi:hypothetical protein AK812_SmicGene33444 [Symbiodinium microadriaticum]|uniref:Uncharacterized protein n=1 Tax=Symbiodinium microadriaticum TaxID=2951 RepID=A0A1Q9CRJ9_SYMMI|nr:hypothetical protein AK812_SmicGene33444 [Symbiodinium microadriaticum]
MVMRAAVVLCEAQSVGRTAGGWREDKGSVDLQIIEARLAVKAARWFLDSVDFRIGNARIVHFLSSEGLGTFGRQLTGTEAPDSAARQLQAITAVKDNRP